MQENNNENNGNATPNIDNTETELTSRVDETEEISSTSEKNSDTDIERDENEFTEDDYSFDEDDFTVDTESKVSPVSPTDSVDAPHNIVDKEMETARILRKEKRSKFFKKAKLPFFIILAVIVCAFIALFAYCITSIDANRVMNNVYIEELDVSGLTYEDTVLSVGATYLFEDSEITLTSNEKNFTIKGIDIGLSAIPEETAQKAFTYCKSGNMLIDGLAAMKLLVSPHVIVPAAQVDEERLNQKISEFGNMVLGERKQHYLEFGDDGMVTIYSGQTGYNGDQAVVYEQILNAFHEEHFSNINVAFAAAQPDEMTLEAFDALVYKDPIDARYEVSENKVNIIAGETGRYINKDEAAPLLINVYEGCEPVKIPFYISTPAVNEETLKNKLFSTTLGSFSTSYGTSTSNRCANIARSASLINGTVIESGGVFSYNDTVGRRSVANGFHTAKEYVDGKSVDGIGGGTCQVSSTLYSAVLYADMTIVERLNHMMSVGYIPLGQDATVSDGGVDFKFKNSSDYPVKISAYTSGKTITIAIIGTDWEPHREVKISNTSSTSGRNTVVHSKRYVYANGELISTDTLNSSTYMPHPTPTPAPAG